MVLQELLTELLEAKEQLKIFSPLKSKAFDLDNHQKSHICK